MTARRPPPGRKPLVDRVLSWIHSPSVESWEHLALAVHRWQHQHSSVIRALCPEPAQSWDAIPPIPVELYRDVEVGTVPADGAPIAFHTSGTTQGRSGVHRLWSTELYDRGSLAWTEQCLGALPTRVAATLEDPQTAPSSSLAHMVSLWSPSDTSWHVKDATLDVASLNARAAPGKGPLFVATTAFALVQWLDAGACRLPPDSRVMVTGGFKGRVQAVDEHALYQRAAGVLGAEIVTEYGMTELSSQLWSTPGEPYRPPPWLRARAIDPLTRQPCPVGTPGQLQFFDLANLDSSLAVQTGDYGSVDAEGRVRLMGRVPRSDVRGCSLTVEQNR